MEFLSDKKNLFFVSIIVVLSIALIATSLLFAKRGADINAAYETASKELETAEKNLLDAQTQKDEVSSQLEAERKEKERLKIENDGLRKKIEDNPAQPRHLITVPRSGYKFFPQGEP